MSILNNIKNVFTEQVEVPDQPQIHTIPNMSVPSATAMLGSNPAVSFNQPLTQPVDQEAIKALDEKSKAKFQAAINAKAPKFFNKLNDLLTTLAEDMPNESIAYKTAIKLLIKEGATPQLLLSDLDICITAVEENNKDFIQSADKKLSERISNRQANIVNFDQAIIQKQQQIATLQNDIATLTVQKNNESAAINEETQKVNLGKERFVIVYNQLRTQLQKQKENISLYSK